MFIHNEAPLLYHDNPPPTLVATENLNEDSIIIEDLINPIQMNNLVQDFDSSSSRSVSAQGKKKVNKRAAGLSESTKRYQKVSMVES